MLPEHAPFTPEQRKAIDSLVSGLDPVQRGWLSGFLAASDTTAPISAPVAAAKLTVL
ncbi:MAG: hypothetical protein WCH40_09215 [Verrucomicrobiales bacterium]